MTAEPARLADALAHAVADLAEAVRELTRGLDAAPDFPDPEAAREAVSRAGRAAQLRQGDDAATP